MLSTQCRKGQSMHEGNTKFLTLIWLRVHSLKPRQKNPSIQKVELRWVSKEVQCMIIYCNMCLNQLIGIIETILIVSIFVMP